MKRNFRAYLRRQAELITGLALITLSLSGSWTGAAAKEKVPLVSPDDPTLRLYQLLDTQYSGKLDEFCIIGDVFNDPKQPDHQEQHILRVEYDKNHAFGKLRIYVRTIMDKLTPDQLKTYTPKQIYDDAETDSEKFTKTDPGSFGRTGDLYFRPTSEGGPLASVPITDEARAAYEHYVTGIILPALQKK